MPYVSRDPSGTIASLHKAAQTATHEFLPDDHADVQAFVGHHGGAERFAQLDADFVRVLEDVIDTLIAKNVFNITDLPSEAQVKLFSRKSYREHRAAHALHLFGESQLSSLIDHTPVEE